MQISGQENICYIVFYLHEIVRQIPPRRKTAGTDNRIQSGSVNPRKKDDSPIRNRFGHLRSTADRIGKTQNTAPVPFPGILSSGLAAKKTSPPGEPPRREKRNRPVCTSRGYAAPRPHRATGAQRPPEAGTIHPMPGRMLRAARSAVGAYGAEKPGRRISEECKRRRPDKPPKTRSGRNTVRRRETFSIRRRKRVPAISDTGTGPPEGRAALRRPDCRRNRSEASVRELRFGRKFAGEKQRPVMRRRPNENTVHGSITGSPGKDGGPPERVSSRTRKPSAQETTPRNGERPQPHIPSGNRMSEETEAPHEPTARSGVEILPAGIGKKEAVPELIGLLSGKQSGWLNSFGRNEYFSYI